MYIYLLKVYLKYVSDDKWHFISEQTGNTYSRSSPASSSQTVRWLNIALHMFSNF